MYKFYVHMFCILLFFDQWPLTYGYTVEDKHFRKVFLTKTLLANTILSTPFPEFLNF